jgi:hypothetical protein
VYCQFSRVTKTLRKKRRRLEWKTRGSYFKPSDEFHISRIQMKTP